ncbi:MAG: hypothetical protein ABIB47_04755 [Candidatus Woesearchaeota archaeon]
MNETVFLYDEEWEEQKKDLQNILSKIENPEVVKNVFVLETFMRGCAYTFVKKKYGPLSLERLRQNLSARTNLKDNIKRKLFKIPVGVSVEPVPKPIGEVGIHEYKDVPQYVEKVVNVSDRFKKPRKPDRFKKRRRRLLEGDETLIGHKDLIKDKITKRVLASVNVADKYIVDEPNLDGIDLQVLNKIKKKRKIKNMEKGWELIQKYGKKFNLQEGHDTNVKYYLVNDVFGLGRIEPFLHDHQITGIICDEYNKPIEVEFQGKKLETNIKFASKEELKEYLSGVAEKIGVKLDKKNTSAEGSLRGFTFFLDAGENLENPKFSVRRG